MVNTYRVTYTTSSSFIIVAVLGDVVPAHQGMGGSLSDRSLRSSTTNGTRSAPPSTGCCQNRKAYTNPVDSSFSEFPSSFPVF